MNELLARAGSVFLAPAPAAAPAPATAAVAPPVGTVGVLAEAGDLRVVAGGVAADLRRRAGARTAIVCRPGPPRPARSATVAARHAARRLAARGLGAVAAGSLCHVSLPADPQRAEREARRVLAAAGGAPVVLGFFARCDTLDRLLAEADRLLLSSRPSDGPAYLELALESLAALGPPAALVGVPVGFATRRAAALGLLGLRPTADTVQEAS